MASAATTLHAPAFLRWRHQRWPRASWARWVLRIAVAIPFVALTDVAYSANGASPGNRALHHQAATLRWANGHLGWVAHSFPPIPLSIARVFPGGAQGLAIAGALCTGILIQLTIERMILRSVPISTAVVLATSVVGTPIFWFLATQDFTTFLTLSLLSVALTGLLDFTFNRSTESGFIAGIGFGLACLCDVAAVPFAIAGALATLFVAPQTRAGREIARRRAAATVVLFPTAAVMSGWAFLQWRFTGSWTASFRQADPSLFGFGGGVWGSLEHSVTAVGTDLVFVPVLIAASVMLLARRPSSLMASVAFLGCVILDLWLGARLSSETVVVLLGVVALAMLPERLSFTERATLWGCVVAQVAVAFVGLHHGLTPVAGWLHRLATVG
ncbi:MAG: hypothetical protein ACRDVW_00375 [Acidimicrobiales bacterium]